MAQCKNDLIQTQFKIGLFDDAYTKNNCWVIMESDDNHDHQDEYNTTTSSSSIGNSICSNISSSTSSELLDDASSSNSSCSSSSNSNGPLFELSELMAQLPIKRGLSKYFNGKSQSFTSLSKAMSTEDLAKKENPYNIRRKLKACKSYANGFDTHKPYTLPKATISKKPSRASLSFTSRRSGGLLGSNNKLSPLHVQKNL